MSSINQTPIRVGISGLGRAGWFLHALPLRDVPDKYKVVAVMDTQADRRDEAVRTLGCRAYDRFDELADDDEIDLIVVAGPNCIHAEQSIRALRAGRHVVVEKSMAQTVAEADRMIAAAAEADRILTVFQCRRYFPGFIKVREVIDSGKLGRIVQIRIIQHIFRRRWDWQTLTKFDGGELFNGGAHRVDQAVQLLGDVEPEVFCHLDRVLASGDAEDHCKIILSAPGAPLIDIELTNSSAYAQALWFVMGSSGGLTGDENRLEWKYVDWSKMPPRPVDTDPTAANRQYCPEQYEWIEESWDRSADAPPKSVPFYDDLYETIRNGAPLVITPRNVRRQIAILEKCAKVRAGLPPFQAATDG